MNGERKSYELELSERNKVDNDHNCDYVHTLLKISKSKTNIVTFFQHTFIMAFVPIPEASRLEQ